MQTTANDTTTAGGKGGGRIRDILFQAPLFLALFATTFSVKKPLLYPTSVASMQGDEFRTIIFGSIYLLTVFLLLTRIQSFLILVRHNWAYLLFLFYVICSAAWSAYPGKVFITWGHFVGHFLVCAAAVMALQGSERQLFRMLTLFGALAVAVTLATVLFFPSRGIMDVGGTLRWVGLAANANTLGMVLLITFWVYLVNLVSARTPAARLISVLFLALTAVCLYGSDSMTCILLSLFMTTVLPVMVVLEGKRPSSVLVVGIIGAALATSALMAAYLVKPELFIADHFFTAVGRTATFTGRTDLWKTAISAIGERPLLGWSFDALKSVRNLYSLPIRASHFHNGYLDLLVRGGATGLILVLVLLAQTAFNLLRIQAYRPRLFSVLTVLMTVLLLHNFAEASLGSSPHSLWLMMSLVFIYLNSVVARGIGSGAGDVEAEVQTA